MLQMAMKDLRGHEVVSPEGRVGAVEDLYFDGECWQLRYLLVATGPARRGPHLLVSAGCVAAAYGARERLVVDLSRAQARNGAGAWPAETARRWLDPRCCSGLRLLGAAVEAQDGHAGRIVDLLVDDEEWSVHYLIVGLERSRGSRHILVPLDWVRAFDPETITVRVRRTLEQLRRSPSL